jgi:hypothetical protein
MDFAVVGYETATGAVTWATRIDGGDPAPGVPDLAKAIGVSTDQSRVLFAGTTGVSGGGSDYYTAALDATTGALKWHQRYDGGAHQDDTVSGLVVGPDSFSVYVTGSARLASPSNSDFVTVGYSQLSGARDYTATFAGTGGMNDTAVAVVASPGGSAIYVTGIEGLSPSGSQYSTVAFDSTTGQTLWVGAYQGPMAEGFPVAIAIGPTDGSVVVVTGQSFVTPGKAAMVTVAYDAA